MIKRVCEEISNNDLANKLKNKQLIITNQKDEKYSGKFVCLEEYVICIENSKGKDYFVFAGPHEGIHQIKYKNNRIVFENKKVPGFYKDGKIKNNSEELRKLKENGKLYKK